MLQKSKNKSPRITKLLNMDLNTFITATTTGGWKSLLSLYVCGLIDKVSLESRVKQFIVIL